MQGMAMARNIFQLRFKTKNVYSFFLTWTVQSLFQKRFYVDFKTIITNRMLKISSEIPK